jgi:hypothetical protein
MKVLSHDKKRCRLRPFTSKPAAKPFPRDIRSFPMPQGDDVDECELRRVNADGKFVSDSELLPTEIERLASEDMNIDRLAQSWNAAAAREGDVDTRRDGVHQSVAGKCSDQA